MTRLYLFGCAIAVCVLAFTAMVAQERRGSAEANPRMLDEARRWTFEELGWSDDVTIYGSNAPATLEFDLPRGITQGTPLWYGVKLDYAWAGVPAPGDFAFFYVLWNGKSMYQFKTIDRHWDPGPGAEWQMADFVFGGSAAYEVTNRIEASSSNVATIDGVGDGGPTAIEITIDDSFALGGSFELTVHKSSEVFATLWQPPSFEVDVDSSWEEGRLIVETNVENSGWQAPSSQIEVVAVLPDGSRVPLVGPVRGPVEPMSSPTLLEEFELQTQPDYLVVRFDWGTGAEVVAVSVNDDSSFRLPLIAVGGYWGALLAFVVAWLAFSMATSPTGSRKIRPRMLVLASGVVLTGSILVGLSYLIWRANDDSDQLDDYPFPLARELPLLSQADADAAIAALARDPDIQSLFPNGYSVESSLVATREGQPFGVYMALFTESGLVVDEARTRWLSCDGETQVTADVDVSDAPGAAVIVDSTSRTVVQIAPLAGVPDVRFADIEIPTGVSCAERSP